MDHIRELEAGYETLFLGIQASVTLTWLRAALVSWSGVRGAVKDTKKSGQLWNHLHKQYLIWTHYISKTKTNVTSCHKHKLKGINKKLKPQSSDYESPQKKFQSIAPLKDVTGAATLWDTANHQHNSTDD